MINCTFEDGGNASLRHTIVDCLVLRGDEILLVKRVGKLLEGGKWGLIGGFIARDETVAEGAQREIHEETGFNVNDLTLLRIIDNPKRPHEDRQNIAFVYFCQADKKDGEADWESDEQKWFKLDNIPPKEEIAFDHYEDIELYKKYLKEKFSLPVLK